MVHRALAQPSGVLVVEVDPAAEGLDVLAGPRIINIPGATVAGLEGDPRLDGAHRVEELVELTAILSAAPVAEGAGVVAEGVEAVRLIVGPGTRVRSRPRAEQPVEREFGVDLAGDRGRRARP